jgi:hypothetical protein
MKARKRYGAAIGLFCSATLLFAGCASPRGAGSAYVPSSPALLARNAASIADVAGRYRGKFLIGGKSTGEAYFNVTQRGTAVGGWLKLVLPKSTIQEPVAMTLDASNNTLVGNATDPSGATPCTYALRGSYNSKTFVFKGTSTPLTCSGKAATFRTVERCFYETNGTANDRRHPDARGIIEC